LHSTVIYINIDSSKDATVYFNARRANCVNINEFIPDGNIIVNVSSSMSKNLLVLMKISPNAPWSFEEDNADLVLSSSFDFIDYRSNNIGFSNNEPPGYNGSIPHLNLNRGGAHRYGSVTNDGIYLLI
jgi:hypothetical protein